MILCGISLLLNALLFVNRPESRKPHTFEKQSSFRKNRLDSSEQFPFLSKRIFVENQNDILLNFLPLRYALQKYVASATDERIGLYFEYLPSGASIGVNEKMEIESASLLKIPVVMAMYYLIETNQIARDEVIELKKDQLSQKFGSLWKRGAGAKITAIEAIRYALTESDNTATRALLSLLPDDAIKTVFDSIDIPFLSDHGIVRVSPKNYTSVLRSLYLSSFLKEESSNEILDLLTQSTFDDQIRAGVPQPIKVAHKIGVYDELSAYSDCGIVFLPSRPYSLCIIGYGDKARMGEHMRTISLMIYQYVTAVSSRS